jgi:hypothetical protein
MDRILRTLVLSAATCLAAQTPAQTPAATPATTPATTPGQTPASAPVPSPAPVSATGLWKVAGEVMGTPITMMCNLTQTGQKLTGECAGGQDGFAPHKVTGKFKKSDTFEFYFQTLMRGSTITLFVDGAFNEDWTKIYGGLDVEPMSVGGTFDAIRMPTPDSSPTAPDASTPASPPASPPAP